VRCKRRTYRARAASWGLNSPGTRSRSDDDAVLLRHKADSDELARVATPAATATHKPIPHIAVVEKLIEALGFRQLRGAGGIRSLSRRDAHVRRDGLEFRLRRVPFRHRLAEQP